MTAGNGRERKGFLVHGHVQGVGFRWSTTRTARRLGLTGTVRNRDDGSVEVHAEGPLDGIQQLERWLHQGPGAARVESVREIPSDRELPEGFQIVH